MSITPGYTNQEIREIVFEHARIPWGSKNTWLAEQPFTKHQFRKWRRAVADGDISRALVPREGARPRTGKQRREVIQSRHEEQQAKRIAELEAETARLKETNETLGKAIGLLHNRNVEEPDDTPSPQPPKSS